jgi:hypothetical protein
MLDNDLAYMAVINDCGMNAMMNADEMMRNCIDPIAFEYMQKLDTAERIANNPILAHMQSAFENIKAMQTSLESAMNNSVLETTWSEDRIFSGVSGGFIDDASKFVKGLEETEGIASLKGDSNISLFAGLATEFHAGESFATSSINDAAGLIGSSFGDDFKKTSLGLAITSLEENARQFGFAQSMSPGGVSSFDASPISDAVKGYMGSSFGDCFEKTYLWPSLEESSQKWADCMPKMMEVEHIPEPMLILPAKIESELHDHLFIAPRSREVTLSDETIEKLAKKLAGMGSKVIVIAKNKGVAIMGNVSNNKIDTGDIIPD